MIKNTWNTAHGSWFAHIHSKDGGNANHFYPLLQEQGLLQGRNSVLSIGGGTGHLEAILAKNHGFSVGYVDPSPSLSPLFQKRFQDEGLTQNILEFYPGPFETFASEQKYDLILSIHSWYYIGYQVPALQKALQLLSPNGLLLISMNASQGFTTCLRKAVPLVEPTLNAEELSAWAQDLGYPHAYFESHKNREIAQLLDRKGWTRQGKAWLSYVFRQEYDSLPEESKQKIFQFFSQAKSKKTDWEIYGSLLFEKQTLPELEPNLTLPSRQPADNL